MTERDIERWTREVAEDPGAASFVRLARAYRSQGRRDAARDVVLQGLEHNPEHVDAHGLLALIYVEDGQRQKAGDEWETMLRLDPGNFDASRGLGFLALEGGDLERARRHLEAAADARPDDPAVEQALEVLRRREAEKGAARGPGPEDRGSGTVGPSAGDTAVAAVPRSSSPEPRSNDPAVRDPSRLFDALSDEAPFLGAVVLDPQGLVLAGEIEMEGANGDLLGALINTAVGEARRATELLGIGAWDGMVLDCHGATLHVAGLEGDAVVLLAVESDAPAGWVVRTARRARTLARDFVGERA